MIKCKLGLAKGFNMYVVKKDIVEEANSVWSFVVKKLDLEPILNFLTLFLKELLNSFNSYAAVKKINEIFQVVLSRLELFQKFGII